MQAHCTNENLHRPLAPDQPAADRKTPAHFLYQAATLVAILVFLLSFWSC